MTVDYREFYRGRSVMITGGLGFIGSNQRQIILLNRPQLANLDLQN